MLSKCRRIIWDRGWNLVSRTICLPSSWSWPDCLWCSLRYTILLLMFITCLTGVLLIWTSGLLLPLKNKTTVTSITLSSVGLCLFQSVLFCLASWWLSASGAILFSAKSFLLEEASGIGARSAAVASVNAWSVPRDTWWYMIWITSSIKRKHSTTTFKCSQPTKSSKNNN